MPTMPKTQTETEPPTDPLLPSYCDASKLTETQRIIHQVILETVARTFAWRTQVAMYEEELSKTDVAAMACLPERDLDACLEGVADGTLAFRIFRVYVMALDEDVLCLFDAPCDVRDLLSDLRKAIIQDMRDGREPGIEDPVPRSPAAQAREDAAVALIEDQLWRKAQHTYYSWLAGKPRL